jgi:hypothetical protein
MKNAGLPAAMLLACLAVARTLLFRPARPGRPGLVQGAFLVLRRSAYEAVGGHAGLKRSLLEDVELGRRLWRSGYRVRTYLAPTHLETAMYRNFGEAWQGVGKHIHPVMGASLWRLAGAACAFLALLFVPVASLAVGPGSLSGRGQTAKLENSG